MKTFTSIKDFVLRIVHDFLKTDKGELSIIGKAVKIVAIYFIVKFLVKLSQKLLDRTLETRIKNIPGRDEKKLTTVMEVIKNLVRVLLYFIGITTILDVFHINMTGILAAAGIGGLAIGFGAQSLVKDVITGSFILFEDQYSVGDHVEIKGFEGIIEELGLRVTKIRDFGGELHIIPNGEISIVTNKSRGDIRSMIKVTIAYEEDLDHAIRVLEKMCLSIREEEANIVDGPDILGVSNLGDNGVDITVRIISHPLTQFDNQRAVKKRIKETLEREGIEIPYSKLVIINEEN